MASSVYHQRSPIPNLTNPYLWEQRFPSFIEVAQDESSVNPQTASSCVAFGDCVYLTGIFNKNIDFGNDVTLKANGAGIYVTKFDNSGTAQWATCIGNYQPQKSDGTQVNGEAPTFRLAISTKSVYVVGTINSDFVASDGSRFIFGLGRPFIARLTQNGNLSYIRQIKGPESSSAVSVAVDSADNAYIAGNSQGKVKLEGQFDVIDVTDVTFYVAKIDSDGDWLYLVQPESRGVATVTGITVDQAGNAYIVGTFNEEVIFNDVLSLISLNNGDTTYSARLDYTGEWITARSVFGTTNNDSNSFIVPGSITCDGQGNLYVTYIYDGVYVFGQVEVPSLNLSDQPKIIQNMCSILLVKYDSEFSEIWFRRLGATGLTRPSEGGRSSGRGTHFIGPNPRSDVNIKGGGLLNYAFINTAAVEYAPDFFQLVESTVTADPDSLVSSISTVTQGDPVLILSYNSDGSWNWLTVKDNMRFNLQLPVSSGKDNYFCGTEIDRQNIEVIDNPSGRSGLSANLVIYLARLTELTTNDVGDDVSDNEDNYRTTRIVAPRQRRRSRQSRNTNRQRSRQRSRQRRYDPSPNRSNNRLEDDEIASYDMTGSISRTAERGVRRY